MAFALFGIGHCYGNGFMASSGKTKGSKSKMSMIDIVPGKSIGNLHLGDRINDLPKGATISGPGGELDGVQFIAPEGVIEDVWIDNLRKFPHDVRVGQVIIHRNAPLDELKKLLGPCKSVPGIKGGSFFNCESGITIGTDSSETGKFVQLRLKPR